MAGGRLQPAQGNTTGTNILSEAERQALAAQQEAVSRYALMRNMPGAMPTKADEITDLGELDYSKIAYPKVNKEVVDEPEDSNLINYKAFPNGYGGEWVLGEKRRFGNTEVEPPSFAFGIKPDTKEIDVGNGNIIKFHSVHAPAKLKVGTSKTNLYSHKTENSSSEGGVENNLGDIGAEVNGGFVTYNGFPVGARGDVSFGATVDSKIPMRTKIKVPHAVTDFFFPDGNSDFSIGLDGALILSGGSGGALGGHVGLNDRNKVAIGGRVKASDGVGTGAEFEASIEPEEYELTPERIERRLDKPRRDMKHINDPELFEYDEAEGLYRSGLISKEDAHQIKNNAIQRYLKRIN
ncbi:hypothetical protein WJT86_10080 [Microvirga sp. W0021]|uniref:Uncharacterized protein n=1 Tax=Hohaiivirga grylli TaxID=3133970 RepID=A0ABV0BLC7_9HYPH